MKISPQEFCPGCRNEPPVSTDRREISHNCCQLLPSGSSRSSLISGASSLHLDIRVPPAFFKLLGQSKPALADHLSQAAQRGACPASFAHPYPSREDQDSTALHSLKTCVGESGLCGTVVTPAQGPAMCQVWSWVEGSQGPAFSISPHPSRN